MSCDGWRVGDQCQAKRSFTVQGAETREIAEAAQGTVREIDRAAHKIEVEWLPSRARIRFSHAQIHEYLTRIG